MDSQARTAPRVTMDDVARVAGVSRATVSRVMTGNSSVSEETIAKVNRAIEDLGYIPNPAARSLAGYRTRVPTVGLLLRDPTNSSYGFLYSELQRQAEENGFQLVASIPTVRGKTVDELEALSRLLSLGVNGIFLATGSIKPSDVEGLLDKVPMVSVGRPEFHDEISAVGYDEAKHGEIVAEKVLEYGHHRVGVVLVNEDISVPENRRGVSTIRALEAAGVEVVKVLVEPREAHMLSTNQMLELAEADEIDCAVFPTDLRATRFLQAAQIAGVDVPEDVSVVGFDGISRESQHTGLATIRIPVEAVAARASRVMGVRMQNPRQVVTHENFAGIFVSGRTLGPPRRR
ncbi:LacI family DNA-binding transcriptional regulator [Corynebacterium sp.]|uniref:LacI family DNA-binding transcriptional regulator n=1 Tax=Corynebacterium sp. TaxID=1720 RepID=UPI0037359E0E